MSRLGFYLLCGALCSLVLIGQGAVSGEDNIIINLKTTTLPPTTAASTESASTEPASTEPASTSHITTPKPTPPTTSHTTTPKPEPTTPKPTPPTTSHTTTPKPEPTTPKPTPPTTSHTTTPKPEPPTTTSKPTPPAPEPQPTVGNYSWQEGNVTCIVVKFAAQLNVTYTIRNVDNSTKLSHVIMNVPTNANTSGSCSANNDTEQWLELSWSEHNQTASNMTLVFRKNGTNYVLQNLTVVLPAELFQNASLPKSVKLSHGADWQTPLATSYRCAPATALNLTAGANETSLAGTLTLSQLQEEAFRTSAGTGFSAARDCSSGGDVPDAVPIAVGCALGGLVIVVLVAYLVGRRRSAARGYLSM